jgi:Cu/Ag efflux protein CusF
MPNVRTAALIMLLVALPAAALAQRVTKSNTARATATIQVIDHTTRDVTLRFKDGNEETFTAGPEITRFNELKVGDTVEMTYVESVVVQVHKPGDANTPSGTSSDGKVTRGQGSSPSATLSQQAKTTVTVKAVNPAVPSITVLTADGRSVTHKIEDKKNLEGVKAGDKLEITYTEALLVSITPAPKK